MTIRLISGDCRDVLKTLADASVHACITSPPYYNLRDYQTGTWEGGDASCGHVVGRKNHDHNADVGPRDENGNAFRNSGRYVNQGEVARGICSKCGARRVDRQIGLERTPDEYLATMVAVFREVRRVLRPDGVCWVNLGSSYVSGGKRSNQSRQPSRAPACDTDGTAPLGSRALGCACRDQCDGRPDGFDCHRDRNGHICRQQQQAPQPDVTTSHDSERLALTGATPSLLDVPGSTTLSLFGNDLAVSDLACEVADPADGGPPDCAIPQSARKGPSKLDKFSPSDPSASRTSGKAPSHRACNCGSCGLCWVYSSSAFLADLPAKNLLLLPEMFALAMQADGWILRSKLPFVKRSAMPESVTDRPASAVEYVFLLTKSPRYFFDAEAVKRAAVNAGQDCPVGSGNIEAGEQGGYLRTRIRHSIAVGAGRNMRNSDLFYDSLEPEPVADEPRILRRSVGPREARGEPAGVGAQTRGHLADSVVREPSEPLGLICSDAGEPLALDVNPQAFSGAHFACFPEKLVSPLIRAGTSQYGCCAACGAPWRRVVERVAATVLSPGSGYGYGAGRNDGGRCQLVGASATTTGWAAGCDHDAAVVPCTVLDPFAGAGTTLLVADRLQRDAIGIELSGDYSSMATSRIEQDAPLFAGVVEEPAEVVPYKGLTTPRNDAERWGMQEGGVAPRGRAAARDARIVDDAPLLAWGAMPEAAE
jgi:DNA modification methylase